MGHYYIDEALGNYWRGQRRVQRMARDYTLLSEKGRNPRKNIKNRGRIHPSICISRNIGVGDVEMAEILGDRLGFRLLDREILEQIAHSSALNPQSIKTFDDRYPGRLKDIMCQIMGNRHFGMTDYARHLFYSAFFLAHNESIIFVSRGGASHVAEKPGICRPVCLLPGPAG